MTLLSGIPASVTKLSNEIKKQLRLKANFRLQFMELDLDSRSRKKVLSTFA
jgi:hypothetical protein